MSTITLHDYWRSGAAYRVRIALNLKNIAYTLRAHDLRTGEQRAPDYLAISRQGLVPSLEYDGLKLTQSLAMIEWLDEKWPTPALLPRDPDQRAIVRGMSQIIACDIHPLNNLRVLKHLDAEAGLGSGARAAWIARWIDEGFSALEQLVAIHGGAYCFGDTPTLADCCLIPQVYSARRFEVDLARYPALVAIHDRATATTAFADAHPAAQPGAD